MWTPQKRKHTHTHTHPDTHTVQQHAIYKNDQNAEFEKKKKNERINALIWTHKRQKKKNKCLKKKKNVYEIHNVQCDGVDDFTFTSSHDKTKRKSFACIQLNWETIIMSFMYRNVLRLCVKSSWMDEIKQNQSRRMKSWIRRGTFKRCVCCFSLFSFFLFLFLLTNCGISYNMIQ
jgi:hypothetical protein